MKKEVKKLGKNKARYAEGVGRRKTAVARVRLGKGAGEFMVNGKRVQEYFPLRRYQQTIMAPLEKSKLSASVMVNVRVAGGGLTAQAEAIRHGLSRALVSFSPEVKKSLRHLGFLTRDPRMVERKKYGLKKARRAPQWAKR